MATSFCVGGNSHKKAGALEEPRSAKRRSAKRVSLLPLNVFHLIAARRPLSSTLAGIILVVGLAPTSIGAITAVKRIQFVPVMGVQEVVTGAAV